MSSKRFVWVSAALLSSAIGFLGCEDSGGAKKSEGTGTLSTDSLLDSQSDTATEPVSTDSAGDSGEDPAPSTESETGTGLDTGSSDEGGLDLEITAESLCAEVARVMCHDMFACCMAQEIEAKLGVELAPGEAQCHRDMKLHCELAWVELFFALDAGTVSLDSASAEACFSQYVAPKNDCFVLSPAPFDAAPCREWIAGNQAIGESCAEDYECGDADAFCGVNGQCTLYALEGDMCSPSVGCAPGLYWLSAANNPKEGVCDEPAPCRMYLTEDEECRPWRGEHCGSGLTCEGYVGGWPDEPSPGICAATRKQAGEPCASDGDCVSNECIPGLCGDGRSCFKDDGCKGACTMDSIPCGDDADCAEVGSVCELAQIPCPGGWECGSSRCVTNPTDGIDSMCGSFEFPSCPSYCAGSGKKCDSSADCGKVCEGSLTACGSNADCAGTCLLGRGDCRGDGECSQGDICIPTLCVDEGACQEDECRPDRCVSSVCEGASVCQGTPACAEKLYEVDYCELGLSLGDASFI